MKENLGPVAARATVADQVYFQLRHSLITGQFDPGQSMTIDALAEICDTSHMPVREALRRLVAEGALEVGRSGSARVPQVNRKRLDDICRARISLERLAVGIACEKIDENGLSDLIGMKAAHEATASKADVREMLLKNYDFHFSIYRASESDVLVNLIGSLWLQYGPFMRMLSDHIAPGLHEDGHREFMRGHAAIIDALQDRDKVRAKNEMKNDIRRTQTLLQRLCTT